jgi:hypothetical protein
MEANKMNQCRKKMPNFIYLDIGLTQVKIHIVNKYNIEVIFSILAIKNQSRQDINHNLNLMLKKYITSPFQPISNQTSIFKMYYRVDCTMCLYLSCITKFYDEIWTWKRE